MPANKPSPPQKRPNKKCKDKPENKSTPYFITGGREGFYGIISSWGSTGNRVVTMRIIQASHIAPPTTSSSTSSSKPRRDLPFKVIRMHQVKGEGEELWNRVLVNGNTSVPAQPLHKRNVEWRIPSVWRDKQTQSIHLNRSSAGNHKRRKQKMEEEK